MGFNYSPADEQFILYDVLNTIITGIQVDSKPYFRKGFSIEIANIIKELGMHESSTVSRFPFIYLPVGYTEEKENNLVVNTVSFDLFIITESLQKYSTDERFANIFEGELDGYYDDLIEAVINNKWFYNQDRLLPHTRTNLPYLGAEGTEQNFLNQVVDAIKVSFSNIEIIKLKNY